jgi:hypothetical protein
MPRTRITSTTYMVSWYDDESDTPVTDQYTTRKTRDAWAAELHDRGIEVEVWERAWS